MPIDWEDAFFNGAVGAFAFGLLTELWKRWRRSGPPPREEKASPPGPDRTRPGPPPVRPSRPALSPDAERRRLELSSVSGLQRGKASSQALALSREPDLGAHLRFTARQCGFDAGGLRARMSDGASRELPWSQLAEVRARILPSDPPWDSALIVDFVPAAAEGEPAGPIRLLPGTAMSFRDLPGGMASSRKENLRRLILFASSQNPAAAIEADSAAFVREGGESPRFSSIAQFNEYDTRYG